ncbi:hypothetical protein ACLBOM_29520 [Escherichia coli]
MAETDKGEVETIALEQLVGRVSANMILPYPPGVPLLMPGEMLTKESRTVLDFLLMLCSVGQHYPVLKRIFTARNRTKTAFTAYES